MQAKIFLLVPIALIAFFTPLHIVFAQDFLGIGGVLQAIPNAIGKVIASFILAIPTGLLAISSTALQQSIDPQFIRVPYTTGGVIDVAWPIVRDLANMLLVLILIFIGLGTALRLGDYEAKKALPRLFGIALLINFAPVLMGFVVDATNIVMNFFLEGLLGGQVLANTGSNLDAILNSSSGSFDFGASFLVKVMALGFFNMLTAIIFFFYATLFFVRKVMIWILVILSPLALISLILPATQGFFGRWRDQFIQWSTVGIFAAFFLWLGDHTIALAAKGGFTSQLPSQESTVVLSGVGDIMNEVMPFIVADLILLIGFFMGLQSNAIGFNAVKNYSFGQQKFAALKAGGALKRFKDEKIMQSAPLQAIGNKLATSKWLAPTWGETMRGGGMEGVKGAFARTGAWGVRAALTPISGGVRKVGRALGSNILDEQKATIAKSAQESKKWDVPTAVSRLKDHAVSQADKVGILHRLITDFDIGDAMKQGLTMEEIAQLRESARRRGEQHEIDVAFPEVMRAASERKVILDRRKEIADIKQENKGLKKKGLPEKSVPKEIGELKAEEQGRIFQEAFQNSFNGLFANHPERAAWMDPDLMTTEIAKAVLTSFDGRQFGHLVRGQGRKGVEKLQEHLANLAKAENKTVRQWLENYNKQLLRYSERHAGQDVSLAIEPIGASETGTSSSPEIINPRTGEPFNRTA